MKPVLGAWCGVLAALLVVPPCSSRPSPDSDSESWRPLVSGHRVNRYRTGLSPTPGESARQPYFKRQEDEGFRRRNCLKELKTRKLDSVVNKLLCFSFRLLELQFKHNISLNSRVDNKRSQVGSSEVFHDATRADLAEANDRLWRANNTTSFSHKDVQHVFRDQQSPHGSNENGLIVKGSSDETGALKQKRRRRSSSRSRQAKLNPTVVQEQHSLEDSELKWLPVSLTPPKQEEDLDTKTNLITQDLVHKFVSSSLPDLNFPHESAGALVQLVSPLLSKEPSNSKWESASLDDLILSHTTEPIHHHKPTAWHKRPTVILVQDTPQELLPKPTNYHHHHHYHEDPKPEPHVPSSVPTTFPRPTYHYPRPSPEPPPNPKPTYHYPSSEPAPKPVYHYKPSTFNPIFDPVYHYPMPEPYFPYTSVIIHTSTSIHPATDSEPEPSPEPVWTSQSHYPSPEPEPEPEDPDPEPEIIAGDDVPVPEPSPEPPPVYDSPTNDEQPIRPTPPPIYIMATPISAAKPPGSPLNPVTISSGKPPPSIVILASPEDTPVASPPLADPVGGGGGGGGGLIPVIPPIIPGVAGVGGGPGGGGGGGSDCPAVQLFNVQTITNSLENKDCVINLNTPVQNVNGDGQIEAPQIQADVPLDDIPDYSTVATTTKKPSSGSMNVLEYISSFFTSLTIFNPISLSFWSFLFAPVSILLASGLGVAALVLPWLFPSYWFGRRASNVNQRVDYIKEPYKFRDSALRPLSWDNESQRESKSQEPVKEKSTESVSQTTNVGRAESTSPTPIGESLKMVTKQLLQSPEATDMVATDIRTPPKIKTQHLNNDEFVPIGKGEAIPLDADNIHSYHVVANTQYVKPSTAESTPASGISTWILLNGSEQSTQASQKKQPTKPLSAISIQALSKKKLPKPTQETVKTTSESLRNTTSTKMENKQTATITKVENPKKAQQSVNQEPLVKIPALMLQDAKFKNKTPIVVGKVPSAASTKVKSEVPSFKKGNATITPVTTGKVEVLAPQSVRRKVSVTTSTAATPTTTQSAKPAYQYELVPTTSVIVHTDIVDTDTTEEVGTTEFPTTTTKRTRKPGTKKKKKNKNRRRRPAKKPEGVIESKITEENNSTRISPGGSRPLSTRIYNYLSREIMPSVGVGLVGLVLTAGLAGLLLYPFGGGVAARRTYEKVSGPSPDGHMYYYNDYSSNGEVDNGQAEETVFGQVLAGMQQSDNKYEKYPRPSSSVSAAVSSPTHYSAQSKYRYDPSHEYGYQSGYQSKDKYSSLSDVSTTLGRNPDGYSTLPDSASLGSKYSPPYSLSGSASGSQYSAPSASSVITQYGDPKYSSSMSATVGNGYNDPKYSSSMSAAVGNGYNDPKYTSSVDSTSNIGSVQYDSKYSSLDSAGNSDSSGTKYSTLTGLSIEPESSKFTSMTDDQAVKYPQSSKYTSTTDDQEGKYHQNPKYTSITDGQSTKFTSVPEDQSGKYPTSAEYKAYSNPSEIGTQSGTYSSTDQKQPGYADIEYDDTKSLPSLTEEDKSDKSQPIFSALQASDNSYSNVDSMSMFSGSYSNEVRHRQGVLAVEHGPRNIKLGRQKRQVDEKHNEVDGSLPDDQTTTEKIESTTETLTTEKTAEEPKENSSMSHENTVESTTWSMPKEPEFTTITPSADHGFFGFLRRLAQMKLRIGLELLRSTTHAVARYLDNVQKRMETVVRDMDKKTSRQRREILKKLI